MTKLEQECYNVIVPKIGTERVGYMKDNKLKEEFIKYFGEEKWIEEEMLEELFDFQLYVFSDLNIEPVPVIFEDIPEDSRLYIKDKYIAISNKLKNNKIECAKCIAHEARHIMQILYVESNVDYPFVSEWKKDLLNANHISLSSTDKELSNYISSTIEVDAFAYQKYIVNKYYKVNSTHFNQEYENLLIYYIEKMFN